MVRVYSPHSEMELINLRAILTGAGIPFFVHNDHFGSMQVGPRIELVNVKTLFVPEDRADRARDLIEDYVSLTARTPTNVSAWHVVRMVLEILLFQWVVPYKPHTARVKSRTAGGTGHP